MLNIQSPLSGIRSPFGRRGGFSPALLFAGGEPGVWYDPSDLSTLFQDSAGTTPVTAAGQTVALMLDKSKGLTLGPELVTNGGFDTDTDWPKGTGWTISGGSLNASVASGFTDARSSDTSITLAGRTYQLTFDLTVVSGGVRVFLGGFTHPTTITTSGTKTLVLVATSASYVAFVAYGSGGAFTGSIDNVSVKLLPGNHATQATAAARPTYQTDGTLHWLSFDGVDDFLVTPTITPATDKVQVFAGVRKLSDAAQGILLESSTNVVDGGISVIVPSASDTAGYRYTSRGTLTANAIVSSGYAAPITNVLTGLGDISGDSATLRIDGTQVAQSTNDQGTGNYLAYPMYIGRRGGTSLPFNGNIYGLVTRFGANLDATAIGRTETYVSGKTGVVIA